VTDRGYQENFYSLYDDFQNDENRLSKGRKVITMLQRYGGRPLEQLECLDVGCSSGVITTYAARYFKRVTGLDYDTIGLKLVTEEQKKESLYIRGDAMQLPFDDDSFDAIICAQVYEHVPNDLRLFAEIERVLRPNGMVFFSGPNKAYPIELHHYLPFLQWLPEKLADKYVQLFGKGDHFYERSRTIWNLREVFRNFEILDLTIPVLRNFEKESKKKRSQFIYRTLARMPRLLRPILLALMPNFNLILRKPVEPLSKKTYIILD